MDDQIKIELPSTIVQADYPEHPLRLELFERTARHNLELLASKTGKDQIPSNIEPGQSKAPRGAGVDQSSQEPVLKLPGSESWNLKTDRLLSSDYQNWQLSTGTDFDLTKVRRGQPSLKDFDYFGKEKPVPFKDGFQDARSTLDDLRTFDLPFGDGKTELKIQRRCGQSKAKLCLQFQRRF